MASRDGLPDVAVPDLGIIETDSWVSNVVPVPACAGRVGALPWGSSMVRVETHNESFLRWLFFSKAWSKSTALVT